MRTMSKAGKTARAAVVLAVVMAAFAGGWWLRGERSGSWRLETPLHAEAAVASDQFAMATGPIDDDVEGLYTLDFLTGELQCAIMSYRTGQFNALFKTNVVADLGLEQNQNPQYLLLTGNINFPRGAGFARPARSVVYVLDTNTGNFAAYGLPWRREVASIGRPQGGNLLLLDRGKARAPLR